ncbi:MAG: retron St85 family effector protein [Flavobacteriaceae bacterium]|nr:retron St85 family effector protein [Flavobacteriaceae bacterium]
MIKENSISKEEYKSLAQKIQNDFFKPINTFKTSLFLCGADINMEDKVRYKIAEEFSKDGKSLRFDIIYPEDIFDEILYSSKRKDLLSLENLLAKSVDVVLIVPESPGSFAELGAFANNSVLRNQMVCVLDIKYKKNKSFINQGPLRLIKSANKDGVVFVDTNEIPYEMYKIISAIRKTKRTKAGSTKEITLLNLDSFLLPAIYLLEPVNEKVLENIIANVIENRDESFILTKTALTTLTKNRLIENTINGYKLSELGITRFNRLMQVSSRIKIQDETVALDDLRLEILNFINRRKKMKI